MRRGFLLRRSPRHSHCGGTFWRSTKFRAYVGAHRRRVGGGRRAASTGGGDIGPSDHANSAAGCPPSSCERAGVSESAGVELGMSSRGSRSLPSVAFESNPHAPPLDARDRKAGYDATLSGRIRRMDSFGDASQSAGRRVLVRAATTVGVWTIVEEWSHSAMCTIVPTWVYSSTSLCRRVAPKSGRAKTCGLMLLASRSPKPGRAKAPCLPDQYFLGFFLVGRRMYGRWRLRQVQLASVRVDASFGWYASAPGLGFPSRSRPLAPVARWRPPSLRDGQRRAQG